MKRFSFGLTSLLILLWSAEVWALTCVEIMNQVQVGVPTSQIIRVMQDSGHHYSPSEVQCLQTHHAPRDIVEAARRLSGDHHDEHHPH